MWLKIARQSLWHRRSTALLTLLSLALSVALLLGIDHLRLEAKRSFTSTVSGTDLIVGARSGQLNLLLYTVFRIGNATNNISWQHYQQLTQLPQVAWAVPLALGDSHRGFRVVGTTVDYFKYFRYGQRQALQFGQGDAFQSNSQGTYQTVLGAQVASKLGYQLGQQIVLSHGVGAVSFSQHKDRPFTVVGILAATGTPVDQSVHVSLQGIEAVHQGWPGTEPGHQHLRAQSVATVRQHEAEHSAEHDDAHSGGNHAASRQTTTATLAAEPENQFAPQQITGFLLGLKSKVATFAVQRQINQFAAEPLTAILPGVALAELWQMLSMVENLLLMITLLVLITALVGLVSTLMAAMRERQREMAIFRAIGARPWQLFLLIELEVLLLTVLAILAGLGLLSVLLLLLQPWLSAQYALVISVWPWHAHTAGMLAAILGLALLLGAIPSYVSYRQSLQQSLMLRL